MDTGNIHILGNPGYKFSYYRRKKWKCEIVDFFPPVWNQQSQLQQYRRFAFSNLGCNIAENLYLIFQHNSSFGNNDYIHKLIKDTYFAISGHFTTDHPTNRE